MAFCNIHSQTYDPLRSEFCLYCGDPQKMHIPLRQVAKRLAISEKIARKWFRGEPGVLPTGDDNERCHLRIPEAVIERVRKRHAIGGL